MVATSLRHLRAKMFMPLPRPRFSILSIMVHVLFAIWSADTFFSLFRHTSIWYYLYFHVYLKIISLRVQLAFSKKASVFVLQPMKFILCFGFHKATWKFISSAVTIILLCEFAKQLNNALFVRPRSHSTISYATRPVSARAIISMLRLKFNSLHKWFREVSSWGAYFTCLSIINAIVHFGDVRWSTVYYLFSVRF